MAEMAAAATTEHFCALTEKGIVRFGDDILRCNWRCEARPSGTGLVFVFRPEQVKPAGRATVNAMLVNVGIYAAKGPFSPFFPQDVVLFLCQLLFPLFFCFSNGFAHDVVPFCSGIDLDRRWR